jgi:hypothetical protein
MSPQPHREGFARVIMLPYQAPFSVAAKATEGYRASRAFSLIALHLTTILFSAGAPKRSPIGYELQERRLLDNGHENRLLFLNIFRGSRCSGTPSSLD